MKEEKNYTGYACINSVGLLVGVRRYESIGLYTPCVYLENGVPVRITLGGFPGQNGTTIPEEERRTKTVYLPWS